MIAKELISTEVIALQPSHTGDEAIQMMNDFHVKHLPVVRDEQIIGVLSEEQIWNFDPDEEVSSYNLIHPHYAQENDHIYEVMRIINQHKLTLVPVISRDNKYLGVITLYDLLQFFAQSAAFVEHGAVIVLEVSRQNYSLSQIARIVESENAFILNSFVTSLPDTTELEVTLKINRPDIQRILATFVRFGYIVKASFTEEDYINDLKENYDMLMSYLSI
jgi:acetoin utilization protein AcuB